MATYPGAKPSFLQQAFTGLCDGGQWKESGTQSSVVPEPDGLTYQILASSGA